MPAPSAQMKSEAKALAEAARLMTVCNACRYCEGLCAVFPAMELRRVFADGDLSYLANLCHACGACYVDCQFSPPHEFNVNVPRVLGEVRTQSYAAYARPRALSGLLARNGFAISLIAALSVAAFILGFVARHDPSALFAAHTGPGAFYRLMPHGAMVAIFGAAFLYSVGALIAGMRAFWRDIGEPAATLAQPASIWQAVKDAATLRYLDGGGAGCYTADAATADWRRLYHHLTFYGFLLCFASTATATVYHYLAGRAAPYAWYDLPVVLGTLGGLGLVAGPLSLLAANARRDPALTDQASLGMDVAFLAMLLLTGLTGLVLLALRETAAMGLLLALHLGLVLALFLTLPYGKFVHGLYRFLALVRYAKEKRGLAGGAASH